MLKQLTKEIPTPFYAYDKNIMTSQLQKVLTQKPSNLEVFYAMKGNSNLSIVKWYESQGVGVEIASGGELFVAKKAGFTPDRIIYTGPAKTNEELTDAAGIKAIHVESIYEAERLSAICQEKNITQDILVRVNADYEVKTKVQLSGCPSPFGISEEDIEDALEQITKLPNLNFKGIHVYNASGIMDHQSLVQNVQNVFELVQRLEASSDLKFPVIDFGGGLGIDYSDANEHVDIEAFYQGMQTLIEEFQYQDRKLIMELARYLIAPAGYYVTQIMDQKHSRGKNFLITDGGVQHFMRTSLFGENHSTQILQAKPTSETQTVNITGSLCTSIDVLAKDITLPIANIKDFVIVQKAGCYGFNVGLNHFLSHEMPAEVLFDNDNYCIIRSRGKHQDLLLNQE